MIGEHIHQFATQLWPIPRSITGDGVRQTLDLIKEHIPSLVIHEVPSGTRAFDWTVPMEWAVNDAWIKTPNGEKICEFKKNALHLVGYSTPLQKTLSFAELNSHLYSLPEQRNAIPYVTSYYDERWGFCLTQEQRNNLPDGQYEVCIDTKLFPGSLTYGEVIIPGDTNKEVFLSTYICHPSMANNELSGPTVTTFLAKWLLSLENRRYTYRIVFIPETIGSITYLSRNVDLLKERVIAGFNVTCVGDDRAYSFLPSRNGNTLSDIVGKHVLHAIDNDYIEYTWADRGSDERQYCAPLIDLPIASIMRSKYYTYPEYHTSLDNLTDVVTPTGLEGGYNVLRLSIEAIERNKYPLIKVLGEPQLGRRGLRPTLTTNTVDRDVYLISHLITWSDGRSSLIEIANMFDCPVWDIYPVVDRLVALNLIDLLDNRL